MVRFQMFKYVNQVQYVYRVSWSVLCHSVVSANLLLVPLTIQLLCNNHLPKTPQHTKELMFARGFGFPAPPDIGLLIKPSPGVGSVLGTETLTSPSPYQKKKASYFVDL